MKLIRLLLHYMLLFLLVLIGLATLSLKSGLAARFAMRIANHAAAGRIFDSAKQLEHAGIAVVPGTSIRGELLKQRVLTAAELYHSGKANLLLLSGDGRTAAYNEPLAMRVMLRALNIPDVAMIDDERGLTTFDSVQHALELAGDSKIIFVSQAAHCRRAILIARGLGGDAQALIAGDINKAPSKREELATLRAVLDLTGLRTLTSRWKGSFTEGITRTKVASL